MIYIPWMYLTTIEIFLYFPVLISCLMQCTPPPPGPEGVGVCILCSNYFYFRVRNFNGCRFQIFWYIVIIDILYYFLLKNADIKQSKFDLLFRRSTYGLPSSLTGFKYGSPFFIVYACIFLRSSDLLVSVLIPLYTWFLCSLIFTATSAGFLSCLSW